MFQINSYEDFCRSFNGTAEEKKHAELLLYIQDRMISVTEADNSLDAFLAENANSPKEIIRKDALSRITDICYIHVRAITENMRGKIIRENVKMPFYKARDINSRGLMWLSYRPGKTVKEKIANSDMKMMAVQRRNSLDTGENRLFLAFLKELANLIDMKRRSFPEAHKRAEEENYFYRFRLVTDDSELSEIRRWENLPPNNTLLSDKHYKVIWQCWNELKQIDELTASCSSNISKRLCTVFFVELLIRANQFYRFPQMPFVTDYAAYSIDFPTEVFGISYNGGILELSKKSTVIIIRANSKTIVLSFEDTRMKIEINGKQEKKPKNLSPSSISDEADQLLTRLGNKKNAKLIRRAIPKSEELGLAIMDPFFVRPRYIADGGDVKGLSVRALYQTQRIFIDSDKRKFSVPCDIAEAILMKDTETYSTSTYSVLSAMNKSSDGQTEQVGEQIDKLIRLLAKYVPAKEFTYVFPDIYNDFQLSPVHKSLIVAYRDVRSLPRSISAAFAYMSRADFSADLFPDNSFLLVIDLIDTNISFTLVCGKSPTEAIPGYDGNYVWERHPTSTFPIKNDIKKLIKVMQDKGCERGGELYELFGLEGLESERDKLTAILNDNKSLNLSQAAEAAKNFKVHISDMIKEFIAKHSGIIKDSQVCIVTLSPALDAKNDSIPAEYMAPDEVLRGCAYHEELRKDISVPLWQDHLPYLAIKRLYGVVELVNGQAVEPKFNVEQKISINKSFTLPAGKKEHILELLQSETSDTSTGTRYAAVVTDSSFPLDHNVACRLDLTYQYGAEMPYKLTFTPIGSDTGFKAEWEELKEYPYDELGFPDFPLPKAVGDSPAELIKRFKAISRGYHSLEIGEHTVRGAEGQRRFEYYYADEKKNIIFEEGNLENRKKPDNRNLEKRTTPDVGIFEEDFKGKVYFELKFDGKYCYASNIRSKNVPSDYIYGGKTKFFMHQVFAGNRSVSEYPALKDEFNNCRNNLLDMYKRCNGYIKFRLFDMMSLVAADLGDDYYNIAVKLIEKYDQSNKQIPGFKNQTLPYYIGYAIGDASDVRQQELLERIYDLEDKAAAVYILSKAIWNNKVFLRKMGCDKILLYFRESVKRIQELIDKGEYNTPNIIICLEYALGAFRAREFGDDDFKRSLSLNDEYARQLYKQVETIITKLRDSGSKIRSFVKIEVEYSGEEYEDIHPLLYALLVYITGNKGEGDIKISGLDYNGEGDNS